MVHLSLNTSVQDGIDANYIFFKSKESESTASDSKLYFESKYDHYYVPDSTFVGRDDVLFNSSTLSPSEPFSVDIKKITSFCHM